MLSPKLDPEIRAVLEAMASQGGPPLETLPVSEARKAGEGLKMLAGEPEQVARVEEQKIRGRAGSIPIRIYSPEGNGPFPGVVYFHGGGWVIGDLDTHDNICRAIARRAGAVVVSVDYRLAPEHKFPVPLEDCYDATKWVATNAAKLGIDPSRIAVAGDSAGANMATVIAKKLHDEKGPTLALQILVYPVTKLNSYDTPSHKEFAEDHFLTNSAMRWFAENYLARPEDALNPDASPALISDLRELPPALVITAECDPLRDEGEAYAKRMEEAGVPVTCTRYAGMIHPFFGMLGVSAGARKAMDQVATAIKNMQPAKAAVA
jgi:acetyl esterase